jgi:hypothetical protein
MQSNKKNHKTICTKNTTESVIPIPAKITAEIVKGSVSMVKQVRQGVKTKGRMCNEIQVVDELLAVAVNTAIEKVDELVKKSNL